MAYNRIPERFAINCDLQFGDQIIQITDILREYEKSIIGYDPFPCDKSMKITPRGQRSKAADYVGTPKTTRPIKPITIGKEIKDLIRILFSLMYMEIFMSIIYLHHRAHEIFDLIDFTKFLIENLKRGNPESKDILRIWRRNFQCYQARNNNAVDDEVFSTKTTENLTLLKNETLLINRLEVILRALEKLAASVNPERVVTIINPEDVMILMQADFEYPSHGSFFELMHARYVNGLGMNQVKDIHYESKSGTINAVYSILKETITRDFKDKLIGSLGYDIADSKYAKEINIVPDFIEKVSSILTNVVIDFAVQSYNYAKGQTDYATTVTIQLQAFKTIYLMNSPYVSTGLTKGQQDIITTIVLNTIEEKRSRAK